MNSLRSMALLAECSALSGEPVSAATSTPRGSKSAQSSKADGFEMGRNARCCVAVVVVSVFEGVRSKTATLTAIGHRPPA